MKFGKSLISMFVAITILLSGVSYAYWADALIMSTAASTGEFDINFIDGSDTASFSIENMKPGDTRTFTQAVTNNGTVPAKVESVSLFANIPDVLYNDVHVGVYIVNGENISNNLLGNDANLVAFSSVANSVTLDKALANSHILVSSGSYNIKYVIELDAGSSNETQGLDATLTTTFNWTQFNA